MPSVRHRGPLSAGNHDSSAEDEAAFQCVDSRRGGSFLGCSLSIQGLSKFSGLLMVGLTYSGRALLQFIKLQGRNAVKNDFDTTLTLFDTRLDYK